MSPPTISLSFFIFLYLVASQCNGVRLASPPESSKPTESAPYHVVHRDNEFEIRRYKGALWVSSPVVHESTYLTGFGKGYYLLVDYYRGKNEQNVTIEQTYPVKVDAEVAPDYPHNMTYTVYFYVPKKYKHSIPAPISKEIKPVKLPIAKYAAVRRFIHDDDNDGQIPQQIDILKKSLKGTPYQQAASSKAYTILFYSEDTNCREIVLSFD